MYWNTLCYLLALEAGESENKISSDLAPPQFGEDQPLSTTRYRSEDVKPLTLSQVELRKYH